MLSLCEPFLCFNVSMLSLCEPFYVLLCLCCHCVNLFMFYCVYVHYKYLGQTTYLKETTKEEINCRIRTGWGCFGRNREVFLDEKLPMSLRRQVFDQCVLPSMAYGCQTWSLSKAMGQKLRKAQRAMERKMLNLKIKDKVPYTEIRKRTRVQDIVQFVLKQKWK